VFCFTPGMMAGLHLGLSTTSPMPSQSATLINLGGVMRSMQPSVVVIDGENTGATEASVSSAFLAKKRM
jgi:hypothetical protein